MKARWINILVFGFLLGLILCCPVMAAPFAYVTNGDSHTVSVLDTASNAVVSTIPVGSNPRGVAVSPGGNRVFIANTGSNDVSVIDTLTQSVIATIPVIPAPDAPQALPPPPPAPMGIAVHPDGTQVYVANTISGHITVIDTASLTATGSVVSGSIPYGIAVHPAGQRIYVTNSGEDTVSVIDTGFHTLLARIPVKNQPYGIAITPDGKKLYVANYGDSPKSKVSVIDTATHTVTKHIEVTPFTLGSAPYGVAVNATGTKLYVTNFVGGYVAVIDTATDTWTDAITVGNQPIGVSLSPDGTRLYVAVKGKNVVSVIDTETKAVLTEVPVGAAPHAFGTFVVQGLLWQAPLSFSLKLTYLGEDRSGNLKFQTLNQAFDGKATFFEEDGVIKQVTFLSGDGTATGTFRGVASLATETSGRSEQLLLMMTGTFSILLSDGFYTGVAYLDSKGTMKKGSTGDVESISLSGKIAGGADRTVLFTGSFRTTLTP